jgi:hypothetical protein
LNVRPFRSRVICKARARAALTILFIGITDF